MTIKEMCDLNHRHYSERQAVVAAWFRPIYATHKNRRDAELEAAGVGRASGYAARASALLDETPARRTHPAEYRFSDRMELVFRRQKEEQDINWSYYRYVEAHIRAGCFSLDAPRKGRMKVLMSMLSPGFDKPPDYGDLDVCPHHDEPRPEEAPAFLHRRYRKAAPETHNAQEAV